MTTPAESTNAQTVDATGAPDNGQQNSGEGDGGAKQAAVTFATEADFQRRVDELLRDRLERERQKADKAAQKAREDAQAEAAAKNGEWQKLAEQRAARLAEMEVQLADLDAANGKAQRYETALKAQVDALRRDVPKHLLPLLDKLDVAEQLEWLAANREQVTPPKPNGVPATPKAQGHMDAAAQAEARQQSASFYNDF